MDWSHSRLARRTSSSPALSPFPCQGFPVTTAFSGPSQPLRRGRSSYGFHLFASFLFHAPCFTEALIQTTPCSGCPSFRLSFVQAVLRSGKSCMFAWRLISFLLRALSRHIAKPDDRPRSPIAPVSDLGLQHIYSLYAPVTSSFAPGACLLLDANGLSFADRPHVHLPDHLVNLFLTAV